MQKEGPAVTTEAYYGQVIQSLAPGLYWFFGLLLGGKVLLWGLRVLSRFGE
jgi:hypothetical protein